MHLTSDELPGYPVRGGMGDEGGDPRRFTENLTSRSSSLRSNPRKQFEIPLKPRARVLTMTRR